MPKKSVGKVASPLHAVLLMQLRQCFEAKAKELKVEKLSIKDGMALAGASEQLYNQWQNGASPKLDTMETMASRLGVTVMELLGGKRAVLGSPESIEIASWIDRLPDEARQQIARSVHAQSLAYQAGAVLSKRPAKT